MNQASSADQAAGRDRAEQPPEQRRAGCRRRRARRTGTNRIERPDVVQIAEVHAARGHRQRLAVDDADHPVDAGRDAAGEIAGPEFRRDDLVDDPPRGDVGERAFEAVADLDAQMPVVLGDDEDRAVVDLLAADLPGLGDADARTARSSPAPSSARSARRSGCPCASRNRASFCDSAAMSLLDSVPVWSTTRPVSWRHRDVGEGGTRSEEPQRARQQSASSPG